MADDTPSDLDERRDAEGRRDLQRRDDDRRDDERRSDERRGAGSPSHWNGIDLRDNDRRDAQRRVFERRQMERRLDEERRVQAIISDGWPMPGDDN